MLLLFSLLILASAALHLRAEYAGQQREVFLFKPLTTTLILLIALLEATPRSGFYQGAIVAGLVCSLAGDVFLMLREERFVAGLASFLMAHVFYIAAFAGETDSIGSIGPLLLLLLGGVPMLRLLWPHLGTLRGPVLVYFLVILLMAWRALVLWRQALDPEASLAFAGALLFVFSDATLALNRFVRPFRAAQAFVLTSYYAAQWLIACSV